MYEIHFEGADVRLLQSRVDEEETVGCYMHRAVLVKWSLLRTVSINEALEEGEENALDVPIIYSCIILARKELLVRVEERRDGDRSVHTACISIKCHSTGIA